MTDLRDTLAVLATVEDSPSYPARVLALKEERLGLAILEAEDLAVTTDVQLTLLTPKKTKLAPESFKTNYCVRKYSKRSWGRVERVGSG